MVCTRRGAVPHQDEEMQTERTVEPDAPAKGPAQNADARVTRLGSAPIHRLITEFAIPAITGMLVNAAYNIIDSIFLGNAMGEIGLAATQVAAPIMTVFMALSMLVGAGGNALAALRLGEGNKDGAENALGNTVTLCLALWLLVAGAAACPPILDWLLTISSATDEVRPYAATFIRIICFGFILQSIGMGVNNFIRTAGAPNRALGTMVIGAVVCVACNYLFVMQMGLGVTGSALATVCGQAASCASVLWYFLLTKNVPIKLHGHFMKPRPRLCLNIVTLGTASFFVQAGAAVVSFVTNLLLVKYGAMVPEIGSDNALASIGLVMRVAMFTVMPLVGMAVAVQPILGFNYGAKNYGRVRTALLEGILAATSIAVFMWAIVHLFPEQIVNLFGIRDESMVDFTVYALKVQLFMLPVVGFQIVGSNYFQATGQPLKSSILSLSRQILFLLPLLFILPEVLPLFVPTLTGLDALYIATPVSDALAIITTFVFVVKEWHRLKRVELGQEDQDPAIGAKGGGRMGAGLKHKISHYAGHSRTRAIAFTALSIALIAVSAWIIVPIGPIPFTLQMFAVTLVIVVLEPKQAIGAIAGYLVLGAIGVPVFSGMRGGIGVLMGPTGGFLWGYLIGVSAAVGLLHLFRLRGIDNFATGVVAGVVFTAIAYVCGWAQYMVVADVGPLASFAATVAPFVFVDLVKIVAAVATARMVLKAVPRP